MTAVKAATGNGGGRPAFSLRARTLAFATALVVGSVTLGGLAVWWPLSGDLLDREEKELAHAASEAGEQLAAIVSTLRQDALMIAGAPAVQGLVRTLERGESNGESGLPQGFWASRTSVLLTSLLKAKPAYLEARIIQGDFDFREILHVERDGEIVPDETGHPAPDSGEVATFRAVFRPGAPTAMASDIQVRGGPAGTPPRLVVGVHVPLYDSTNLAFGLVVLTVDLREFFSGIGQLAPSYAEARVLNAKGQYLVHPDPAVIAGQSLRVEEEYPGFAVAFEAVEDVRSEYRLLRDRAGRDQGLGVHDQPLGNHVASHRIRFLYTAPYVAIRAEALANHERVVGAGVLAVLLVLPLSLIFGTALARPLQRMTDIITSWTPDSDISGLPVERSDEIGILAREFASLMASLEQRQRQLQREVADREQAEACARDAEVQHRLVIDAMLDGLIVCDAGGAIVRINPAGERMFGFEAGTLLGKSLDTLIRPDRRRQPEGSPARNAVTERRDVRQSDVFGQHLTGGAFPVEMMRSEFATADGRFISVIVRDLSAQRAADAEIRQLATALDATQNSVIITDHKGDIQYVNLAFEAFSGTVRAQVIGRQVREIVDSRVREAELPQFVAALKAKQPWKGLMMTTLPDGRCCEEEVSLSPMRDPNGAVTHWISIHTDITEWRKMEAELRQAQKLESIGQLAAGIAHEINTPIQYVGDNIRFVREAFTNVDALLGELATMSAGAVSGEDLARAIERADLKFLREEVPKALEQSTDGCRRVADIVNAMKVFSHPGQDKTPVDLNRAIASTITVASSEWKYVAEMHTDFDETLPLVVCMPGEFNQVILNMLVNAAHAIGDVVGDGGKGRISVTTRQQGEWAEIRISDTGGGIAPEIRAKIFDPFFTTKQVGKGTGQGLSIAYDIVVHKHGGTIALESEPGKGSTFIIRLPLATAGGTTVRAA